MRMAQKLAISVLLAPLLTGCGSGQGGSDAGSSASSSGGTASQLTELQSDFAAGRIGQAEYDRRREAILVGIGA